MKIQALMFRILRLLQSECENMKIKLFDVKQDGKKIEIWFF
jgi:hypothetical protein